MGAEDPGPAKSLIPANQYGRFLVLLVMTILSGCIHLAADPESPDPLPLSASQTIYYQHPPSPGAASEELLEQNDIYSRSRFLFTPGGSEKNGPDARVVEYFRQNRPGKSPVIVVLPILRGANSVVRSFTKHFAEQGFAVVLVHGRKSLRHSVTIETLESVLRQIILEHRQVLDWIETRAELDSQNIGLFGISLGGIKGALIAAVDRRIKASVLALTGTDIPYLLSYSPEGGVKRNRQRILQEEQLTADQLYTELSLRTKSDPGLLARNIEARRTLLVLALLDRIVPATKGRELRRLMGQPETIYLFSGHYLAILYSSYVKHQASVFFRRQLETSTE